MRRLAADIAIIGAGFGGSLVALLASRLGLRPILVERDRHPRLQLLPPRARHRLPAAARPGQRAAGRGQRRRGARRHALVPRRRRCFPRRGSPPRRHPVPRPHARGDDRGGRSLAAGGPPRGGERIDIDAGFLVDAAGGSSPLAAALGIGPAPRPFRTCSRAIYTHFRHVTPWREVYRSLGGRTDAHPYPCDAAALHHVFDGGWMYVLRFDGGITSAGVLLEAARHPLDETVGAEEEWRGVLAAFPSIAAQFRDAAPLLPLRRTGRLQRRLARMAGDTWAMLPHAACFVDPLHSAGIALTLTAVERLGAIFGAEPRRRPALLEAYERAALLEVDLLDR